jgi:GNAT superfamily N-acetyltransferase
VQVQSLGYRSDLMLLSLQSSVVVDRGNHLVIRTPDNPGFHWGNFVLADQAWVDRPLIDLVAVFHAEHPQAGHVALGVDGVDGLVWADDELAECGLEVERSVVMTATEVHEPAHPNTEAVCRTLTSDADWAAAVDVHAAGHGTFDLAESRDFTQRRMTARREQQEAGLGGWFGAFVDGEMVCGLGLFTDGSGLGRFQDVETVASARRRGLASTLVHHASRVGIRDFAIRELVMVADPDYAAIRIYRLLGFVDSETQVQVARPSP